MARIENYRQVKQEAVEYEMKRRNARKNLDHALIASPEDSKVMQVEGETEIICAHVHHMSLITQLLFRLLMSLTADVTACTVFLTAILEADVIA